MKIIELEFDGGCTGKIGRFGYVITCNKKIINGFGKIENDFMTNNVAEYLGLLKGVKRVKAEFGDLKNYQLMIYGDSRLVIETVAKRWGWSKARVVWSPHKKQPHLKSMLEKILKELNGVDFQAVWVRRNKNKKADALTRKQ